MQYHDFPVNKAPETGRRMIQLTTGDATCYPLYYFIPSFSQDGTQLVYHRSTGETLQLHVLDLTTGSDRQLTHATYGDTQWYPWCSPSGAGVLDHRSVLNVVRDEVIYFDGNEARAVRLDGSEDRALFCLPADRIAIGQNCVAGNGNWFIYIHHDRALYEKIYPDRKGVDAQRHLSMGTVLAGFHLDTGETRTIVRINSPIHHVLPYGEDRLVFCHPANESGMMLTDLQGGWYMNLRTQDGWGGSPCHYVSTVRGLAYEVAAWGNPRAGMLDPESRRRYEYKLPAHFGYTHTGWDPEGRFWFFENEMPEPWKETDPAKRIHDLWFLAAHNRDGEDAWVRLMGNLPCFGGGQKAHFHPQVTPDRRWLLLTGGDPSTGTNQLFLLDIADLADTTGIPDVCQPA